MAPNKKLILLSGGVEGCTVISSLLADSFPFTLLLQLDSPIKSAAHNLFGNSYSHNKYKNHESENSNDFMGKSPKEIYSLIETCIECEMGAQFLGDIACCVINNFGSKHLFIASGITNSQQIQPLLKQFGKSNCLNIHVEGVQKSYDWSITTLSLVYTPDRLGHFKSRVLDFVKCWV